ncbi:MAG: hypothetical protein F6J93_20595 [Oscillatoria sp. SIO1A7]|nr:hypothetical protein [Oscillatoria sp. SIO1A7]
MGIWGHGGVGRCGVGGRLAPSGRLPYEVWEVGRTRSENLPSLPTPNSALPNSALPNSQYLVPLRSMSQGNKSQGNNAFVPLF